MNCPSCGRLNQTHARFCRFCGFLLDPRQRRHLKWGRALLLASGLFMVGITISLIQIADHLPSVNDLVSRFQQSPTSLVYDQSGKVIARLGGPEHTVTPINAISPSLKKAVVAIEDHNYYHNPGFDIKSIVRAALVDLIHHAPVQGASTITEQLAKNLYLSDQKSLTRKIREFLIGLELATHYNKNEILDMYLNAVYFGQGADGVAAAAHVYFDTTPAHLSLAQATLLAGLPQAPSLYDPLVNLKLAKQRQAQVVQAMVRYKDVSPRKGRQILSMPLHFKPQAPPNSQAGYPYPWYIDRVVSVLVHEGFTMSQVLHGGLHIHTALRPGVYTIAQNAVDQWMNKNFGTSSRLYPDHQAAAVVENPHNGHVWAIIGGRNHFTFLQDNLAVTGMRSTGSAIKPLLDYAPALAQGYTQMSVLQDVPIFRNVGGQAWWPSNDNHVYRGYMDLRDALAISDNDIAVHLLNRVGLGFATHFLAHRFDITVPPSQSHSLGSALGIDTNLLALTRGYAAVDNGGRLIQPVFVTRVSRNHKTLWSDHPPVRQAITKDQAFILTQMLRRVLDPHALPSIGPGSYTTGYQLGIGRPAAGKSGTNNNEADAWFMGYEPQMTVGVWEGDRLGEIAQPYTQSGNGPAYGAVAAGPIWKEIMQKVNQSRHLKARPFSPPPGVKYVNKISITSGDRPSRYTPPSEIQGAWFINGTQPHVIDPTWIPVRVQAFNPGTLWHPGCGPFITVTALKPESDWHPGVPRPWDAWQWPPTIACQALGPPGPGHQHPGPKHNPKHRHHGRHKKN